jgi:GxxExxY protein
MHTDKIDFKSLSEVIIGSAFAVLNTLGVGFPEKVYENAPAHELRKGGLTVLQQHAVAVDYDGVVVGTYTVDLLIEGTILVELKAVKTLDAIHTAQCLNYLKATNLRLCLLLNFGNPRMEVKRLVHGP